MLMKLEFTRLHFHPSVVQILSQGDSKLHRLTLASLLYCCVSLSLTSVRLSQLRQLCICQGYDTRSCYPTSVRLSQCGCLSDVVARRTQGYDTRSCYLTSVRLSQCGCLSDVVARKTQGYDTRSCYPTSVRLSRRGCLQTVDS